MLGSFVLQVKPHLSEEGIKMWKRMNQYVIDKCEKKKTWPLLSYDNIFSLGESTPFEIHDNLTKYGLVDIMLCPEDKCNSDEPLRYVLVKTNGNVSSLDEEEEEDPISVKERAHFCCLSCGFTILANHCYNNFFLQKHPFIPAKRKIMWLVKSLGNPKSTITFSLAKECGLNPKMSSELHQELLDFSEKFNNTFVIQTGQPHIGNCLGISEIDEKIYGGKRKNQRGTNFFKGKLLVSGFDRCNGLFWGVSTKSVKEEVMVPICLEYTVNFTDGLSTYQVKAIVTKRLHLFCLHDLCFKNQFGVHINGVEGNWTCMDVVFVLQRGCLEKDFQRNVWKFMFIRLCEVYGFDPAELVLYLSKDEKDV